MDLIFRAIYSKPKYFHFFALISKFSYKYCKSDIFYVFKKSQRINTIRFQKVSKEIYSTESEMYMPKTGCNAATVLKFYQQCLKNTGHFIFGIKICQVILFIMEVFFISYFLYFYNTVYFQHKTLLTYCRK